RTLGGRRQRALQENSHISKPGARIWLGEAMEGNTIFSEHVEDGSQLLCGKRNLAYQFLTPVLLQAGSIPTTRRTMWPATEVLLKAHPFTQGSRGGIALPLQLSIHEAGRIRASHRILTFRFPTPGI